MLSQAVRAGLLCLLLSGCLPLVDNALSLPSAALVPTSFFGGDPQVHKAARPSYPPAQNELALRVDAVGRDLLAANTELALKPLFITYGQSEPELFHSGTHAVHVTEGLVKQCQTREQLAAVLSYGLARMVAERESLANPKASASPGVLPIAVPVGNAGQVGAFDAARATELALHEQHKAERKKQAAPPDVDKLARRYLEKAGFEPAALERARPLLFRAEKHLELEKSVNGSAGPQWSPR